VNILDQRASLKVNIFLKQFRLSHADIVQLVRDGRSKEMGAEKLRGLLKVLPEQEEVGVAVLRFALHRSHRPCDGILRTRRS